MIDDQPGAGLLEPAEKRARPLRALLLKWTAQSGQPAEQIVYLEADGLAIAAARERAKVPHPDWKTAAEISELNGPDEGALNRASDKDGKGIFVLGGEKLPKDWGWRWVKSRYEMLSRVRVYHWPTVERWIAARDAGPPPKALSPKEYAKRWSLRSKPGLSERKVQQMLAAGELPGVPAPGKRCGRVPLWVADGGEPPPFLIGVGTQIAVGMSIRDEDGGKKTWIHRRLAAAFLECDFQVLSYWRRNGSLFLDGAKPTRNAELGDDWFRWDELKEFKAARKSGKRGNQGKPIKGADGRLRLKEAKKRADDKGAVISLGTWWSWCKAGKTAFCDNFSLTKDEGDGGYLVLPKQVDEIARRWKFACETWKRGPLPGHRRGGIIERSDKRQFSLRDVERITGIPQNRLYKLCEQNVVPSFVEHRVRYIWQSDLPLLRSEAQRYAPQRLELPGGPPSSNGDAAAPPVDGEAPKKKTGRTGRGDARTDSEQEEDKNWLKDFRGSGHRTIAAFARGLGITEPAKVRDIKRAIGRAKVALHRVTKSRQGSAVKPH